MPENISELVNLYATGSLEEEDRQVVEEFLKNHREAAKVAAGLAIEAVGPRSNNDQVSWDQLSNALENREETEVVLKDARLEDFVPDPVPLWVKVLRVSVAILLVCMLGYGILATVNPSAPDIDMTPEEIGKYESAMNAGQKLKLALPNPEDIRLRKSLKRIFRNDFLSVAEIYSPYNPPAERRANLSTSNLSLGFKLPDSEVTVFWIVDDS
ncbi:hypothetical protein ACFL54_08190 [Planctomycetota bacterium]